MEKLGKSSDLIGGWVGAQAGRGRLGEGGKEGGKTTLGDKEVSKRPGKSGSGD